MKVESTAPRTQGQPVTAGCPSAVYGEATARAGDRTGSWDYEGNETGVAFSLNFGRGELEWSTVSR